MYLICVIGEIIHRSEHFALLIEYFAKIRPNYFLLKSIFKLNKCNALSDKLSIVIDELRYFFTAIAGRKAKAEGLYFNTDRDAYTKKKVTNRRLKYQ